MLSFGREFIAMMQNTKYVSSFGYKLREKDILVESCAHIYGDNWSTLANTTTLHSQLKKKQQPYLPPFLERFCTSCVQKNKYKHT